MKTIGIDLGTTTISAVVMELESGAVLEAKNIPNDSFLETGYAWERMQDAERVIGLAKRVLDELLRLYPDVSSVGLTGQMHGILYVDRDGREVSPLYTWQDGRGDLREFQGKSVTELAKDMADVQIYKGYGLATHFYHVKKGLVPVDAVTFCTVMDYLGMALTGRERPLVHTSNAAGFGFFDVEQGKFSLNEIRKVGMDIRILPEITGQIEVLGTYKGIPVTTAIGDNQASFLGAVGNQSGSVLLNMGTGGQISVLSNEYFSVPGIETRPFLDGMYLLVGASLCGGRAYACLEQFFRMYMAAALPEFEGEMTSQYEVLEKLAKKGRDVGADMVVMTTFCGTRENPDLRGCIEKISEENFTPENVVYGVLCGMARELHEFYRKIDEKKHLPVECLVGSGNGLRKNCVLQEIFAEMFGMDLALSVYEEEAACGAAKCRNFAT